MDILRNILGGQQQGMSPSGAETIEKLLDRVESSTLLEDRRDAVRALKSLSKKFRLEVGAQAVDILVGVLFNDRSDSEIIGYSLDALCNVMSNEPLDEDEEINTNLPADLGSQFTEMFIKKQDNVAILLSLLEEYDFQIRWPTVKLLTLLLLNRSRDMQEVILVSPQGVSHLMDLLSDSREVIRNDGLLLLTHLCRSNPNIQKIVAFEGAFEKLFDIIVEEGGCDGGVIVEDCLLFLYTLLRGNSSNQTFFKEGSFVQRLAPLFQMSAPQEGWSAQKVSNVHHLLQLVRCLVDPGNPISQTQTCQRLMNQSGLLADLSKILMESGVPADVLTESINTVAEIIRGCEANQLYFATVMAPMQPPRTAIVVLLLSMVNEKQPFRLRCAVLYCFQSFLHKNMLGQSQIVQTLLPSTTDASTMSAGQLLCSGLFSLDSLSTWLAATALMHSMGESAEHKEQLLRVQLATSLGNPPVSLLQQCTNILSKGNVKIQTRVGLLMLLSHWLSHCATAVSHFLSNTSNVPYLISQISASDGDEMECLVQGLCAFLLGLTVLYNSDQVESCSKASLRQIIEKRIGLDTFADKISRISRNESYTLVSKQPQLCYQEPAEVLLHYHFTCLLKEHEIAVVKVISAKEAEAEEQAKKNAASLVHHDKIVHEFKDLIREQDSQLSLLKEELGAVKNQREASDRAVNELKQEIQMLKDHNSLLKAQKGVGMRSSNEVPVENHSGQDDNEAEQMKLKLLVAELEKKLELAETKLQMEDGQTSWVADRVVMSTRVSELEVKTRTLQEEVGRVKEQRQVAEKQLESNKKDKILLENELKDVVKTKNDLEQDRDKVLQDLDALRKEQEDLLVLLADQDTKLNNYRGRLKAVGQEVESESDNDEEDEDDD